MASMALADARARHVETAHVERPLRFLLELRHLVHAGGLARLEVAAALEAGSAPDSGCRSAPDAVHGFGLRLVQQAIRRRAFGRPQIASRASYLHWRASLTRPSLTPS
jgi:hypothetical protein